MKKRDFLKTGVLGLFTLALPRKSAALEYYPTKSDKSWAVLYSTQCGSARDAGVWISEGMDGIANVFDIRENPDLSSYKNIIVGGAIRSAKLSPEMEAYIEKNKAILKSRIRGLFIVCGNRMQEPGPEQATALIDNYLAPLCNVSGVPSKVLLGRITYGLMDEAARTMIQGMNMPEYDNLKRPECMAFGKEVLQTV